MMPTEEEEKEMYINIMSIGMEILSIFEANQDECDIQDFQSDIFYIKICEVLFPEVNFQDLTPGETVDQVGDNINAIIDYIQQIAQDIDLSQLDGYMIANGDLPSIFTILNLVHGLILATIEGEDGQLEQEEYPDDLESDEKQKIDQMLYDEQQIDDYSDLPVGNVRDLLKKKKLSSDTANQEQKSASKLKQSDSANKINDPNLANFNKKDNSHISSKNHGLDDYLNEDSEVLQTPDKSQDKSEIYDEEILDTDEI